jgi:uncharacterized protein (DUF488 family)
MSARTLYTIGYGNRKPEAFFAMLPEGAKIVDVRRSPTGWHQAYCLPGLKARLGDRYRWRGALGNGTNGTADHWDKLPGADDWLVGFAFWYKAYGGTPVVLLCAEADYQRCHRRFVAEEIARRVPGLEIVHL